MKNILYRTATVLILSCSLLLLVLSCSEPYVDRYDPTYRGDYKLSVPVEDSSEYFAFVPVNVPFSHKGDDRYVSFSVATEPEGFVDTLHFKTSDSDSFSLYFTAPFSGSLEFRALRHNDRMDTLSIPVNVKSPFEIKGDEFLVHNDTSRFALSLAEDAQEAAKAVRHISWILDTSLVLKNASLSDTFSFISKQKGSREVKLRCTDFKGNQFTTEPFELGTPVAKPEIMNLQGPAFAQPTMPLEFEAEVKSALKDSGTVKLITGKDTLEKHADFETDSIVKINMLHPGGIADTGSHAVSFVYESSVHDRSSKPYVTYLPVTDHEYYLKLFPYQNGIAAGDSAEFTVTALERGGREVKEGSYSWTVMLSEDTLFSDDSTRSSSISVLPHTGGILTLRIKFTDEDGDSSPELVRMIEVFSSLSAVRSDVVFATPSPAFTAEPVLFQLPHTEYADSTAVSEWIMENGDGDTVAERTVRGFRLTNRFYEPGTYTIRGNYTTEPEAASYSCTLDVLDGSPTIDSLNFPPKVLLHKEKGHISVESTSNGNASVEEYEIILVKDDDTLKFQTTSPRTDISFDSSHAGEWTVSARVKNTNNLWSQVHTSPLTMKVESSLPEVTFSGPDTVLQTRKSEFAVSAQDHDGSIEKIIIDWADGDIDTIQAQGNVFSTKVNHVYADSSAGKTHEISISATDDKKQKSTVRADVYVLRGEPEVFLTQRSFSYDGEALQTKVRGDTIFTPYITSATDDYPDSIYSVHAMVTLSAEEGLGQVGEYFARMAVQDTLKKEWSTSGNFLIERSSTSRYWFTRNGAYFNPGNSRTVECVAYCRDSDGLVDSLSFQIRSVDAPDSIVLNPPDSVVGTKAELAFTGGLKRDYDFISESSLWLNSHKMQIGTYKIGQNAVEFEIPKHIPDGEVEVILELTNSVGYKTRNATSFTLLKSKDTE
ncbi:MAG: hypothetical protein ACLFVE_14970 [Chitinispirillaceae bacterium]